MTTTEEALVLTQAMADGVTDDIAACNARAEVAAVRRDAYEGERKAAELRAQKLAAVLDYIASRLGRPLAEVREELTAEIAEAEQCLAEKSAIAHAAREHVRDLEGYMRIAQEVAAETTTDEGQQS